MTAWRRWSSKAALGAARPGVNNGFPGGPISRGSSTASGAAGYQTVIRTSSRCDASRNAADGACATRCRSPTLPAAAGCAASAASSTPPIKLRALVRERMCRNHPPEGKCRPGCRRALHGGGLREDRGPRIRAADIGAEGREQLAAHADAIRGEVRHDRLAPGPFVRVDQDVERPATASSRTTSPSRSFAIGPPSAASGVTWIAAGTLPEAPDMRPSVTSATSKPAVLQHAERRRQLVQLRHAVGRGPWKRTTATKSRSSSPALKAACSSSWLSKTSAGASITWRSGFTAETLITARPRLPLQQLAARRSAGTASRGRRRIVGVAARPPAVAPDDAAVGVEPGLARVAARGRRPQTVRTSSCSSPASSSSRIRKPHAAGGVEMVHVGAAVRIDAREQRRRPPTDRRSRPRSSRMPAGARHRDQVDRVVGRAAGGVQPDDAVDDRALVDHAGRPACSRCRAR